MVRWTKDDEGIVTVTMDVAGKAVNTASPAFLAELEEAVGQIEGAGAKGVIFASGKERSFLAGADLYEMAKMDGAAFAVYMETGQRVYGRIARLAVPVVAAIGGDALGGGLELALACKRRVAVDESGISIGLPEVKLGLIPAWGGSTRLPRLIGVEAALPLMLGGKTLSPAKARAVGIVDEVVPRGELMGAARRMVEDPHPGPLPEYRERGEGVLAAAARETRRKTGDHYPAPLKLIEVVRASVRGGAEAGLRAETAGIVELKGTETCRNLMRNFFLRQGAKRSLAEKINATPTVVKTAAVIGGGTMGAGIVHGLAKAGIAVRLVEVDDAAAARAMGRVGRMLEEDVQGQRLSAAQAAAALGRVVASGDWAGIAAAELVIEAVVEQMEAKRRVFARLDELASPEAVLATNTSSLSVGRIAEGVGNRQRVVGLHFFNPVPRMTLVELVRTPASAATALATAAAVAQRLGKTAVLVADGPGFIVNRLLAPYFAEAIELGSVAAVDGAMRKWGMPMGPFELLDEIGLDVMVQIFESLATVPAILGDAVGRGWLGKKSGRGFYVYGEERRVNRGLGAALGAGRYAGEETPWRLVLPMVNEAAKLLAEGVADSADAVDLAMVLGTGFAPFRGGPVQWARSVGVDEIVRRMEEFGGRLAPAEGLRGGGVFESRMPGRDGPAR